MHADSLFTLAMAAAVALLITPDGLAGPAPQPGMTWESIRSLPDFGGSWSTKATLASGRVLGAVGGPSAKADLLVH